MADPYISQIAILGFTWAPTGYALCDGSILAIAQYSAVFSLLGKTYGGNGTSNFGIPDLRGRAPVHPSDAYPAGTAYGTETASLSVSEMPSHTHRVCASTEDADMFLLDGLTLAVGKTTDGEACNIYTTPATSCTFIQMCSATCDATGGSYAHRNLQPSIVLNFCISMQGTYPTKS